MLTNAVFDSTIEQYYVLLPYEADKVKTEFTLKNAQVEIGGETYNVQVKANYKPGNVDLEPVKVGGTEKTYISNLVKICVELCPARYKTMCMGDAWRKMDIFKVLREKKAVFLLTQLILSAFYRRIGEQLGVQPGAEMLEAVQAAEKQNHRRA